MRIRLTSSHSNYWRPFFRQRPFVLGNAPTIADIGLMGPMLKLEAFMFPTTHFVIISRGIFVKGAGLAALRGYVAALLGVGVLFFGLTVLMFKKKL